MNVLFLFSTEYCPVLHVNLSTMGMVIFLHLLHDLSMLSILVLALQVSNDFNVIRI